MNKIHVYFINYNDSFYIPFFHKHYSKFCEKIIMYDQRSTDNSREIAQSLGIEVRLFGNNELNDQNYLNVKNNCWKECRGKAIDYVIVVDVDEFVNVNYHITDPFPFVQGYNMISESLPVNDIFEVRTGEQSESYSKQAIFNPDFVEEINYVHGCHKNNAVIPKADTKEINIVSLYHFRMIGGVDRIIERHAMYRNRMSAFNKTHNMGIHYHHADEAKRNEWNFLKSNAKELW